MAKRNRGPPNRALWAYAYDITLPDREDRLDAIQDLLDQEHSEARAGARTWSGRVEIDPQVTRVLVVSDSPSQDREVNRRLEAELKRLRATFEITAPMAVADDGLPPVVNGQPSGNGL